MYNNNNADEFDDFQGVQSNAPMDNWGGISKNESVPITPAENERADDEKPVPVEYAIVKPIPGGLQPIIAPKGQVQLNPVVVPVAFVPYATQNQPIVQTIVEKRKEDAPASARLPEVKDQPILKKKAEPKAKDVAPEIVPEKKSKKKDKVKKEKKGANARLGAFILLILNIAFIAFVVINHFADKIGIASDMMLLRGIPDVIGGWMAFSTSDIKSEIPLFLITVATVIALANFITAVVSLCTGKGKKLWISGLLMLIITLASTLLSAFGIFGDSVKIELNPASAGTIQWLLTFVSAVIFIFGLIFIPKKEKENKDDDAKKSKSSKKSKKKKK